MDENYKDFLFELLALVHPDPIPSFTVNESMPNELKKFGENPEYKPNEQVDPNGVILAPSSISLTVCKIAVKYQQDIISRGNNNHHFHNWITILMNHTEVNAISCVLLIKWLAANPSVLYKLLLESASEFQRDSFCKLLRQALTCVAGIESKYLTEEAKISNSVVYVSAAARLIKLLITEGIIHSRTYWRQFSGLFEVMTTFAKSSPQNAAIFVKEGAIYSLIDFVANKKESLKKDPKGPAAKERKEMGDIFVSEKKEILKRATCFTFNFDLQLLLCGYERNKIYSTHGIISFRETY